jgi:hypothetical protein
LSKLCDRRTLMFGAVTTVFLVGLAAPAAVLRCRTREREREAARQAAPLACRYHREDGTHTLSFSAVVVDAGFNVVADAVDQGRPFVNALPLFGRPPGTLRLAAARLETRCSYQGGRVVPGRLADGRAVFSAVLVFEEHPGGGTWPEGEPLDVDRLVREHLRPADGPPAP